MSTKLKNICFLPTVAFLAAATFWVAPAAASVTLDFNAIGSSDVPHGTIVTTQFQSSFGVEVSGINRGGGPNSPALIVAFDTFASNTADPDLQDPFQIGNAVSNTNFPDLVDPTIPSNYNQTASRFQSALIIQENGIDSNNDGIVDNPDDEGSRPAGSIFFDFDDPISSVGFDLLDVEATGEFLNNDSSNTASPAGTDTTSGYVGFYEGDTEVARVGFDEFIGTDGAFSNENPDADGSDNPGTVVFGNHSANRLDEITIEELEEFANIVIDEGFNRIEFNFGGSGAVDNLTYRSFDQPSLNNVPEASSMLVWTMLGLTVGCYKRRQLLVS